MGQEITTESDVPSPSGGLKKGLKSLSSCDAAARIPGHAVDQGDEDRPNLFQRTMSGTGTFLKKTKNDVVCSARDLPKAATAIKTDGLNGRTAGRVALDVVGTTEVMPHQLIWNAAGSVVKSRTGIDLTPGGLKTKVAMAVIGATLEHGNSGSVGVGLETAGRPNLAGERALSAIELLRGRGSAIQVAANLGRLSGVTEVATTSSITNSVSIAARLGGGHIGGLIRGPVGASIGGPIIGAGPVGETIGARVGGPGSIFGAEVIAPVQMGIRVGPVVIEANRGPRYTSLPYAKQVYPVASYSTAPYLSAPNSVASFQESAQPATAYSTREPAASPPLVVRDTTTSATAPGTALVVEAASPTPVRSMVTGANGGVIAGRTQTFDASPPASQIPSSLRVPPRPLYQPSTNLAGKSAPDQVIASRSLDASSDLQTPAQRAIESMRLAHQQEAIAKATGQPVVLDPQTETSAKRIDREFADAELKAKEAILAAEKAHQKS